MSQKASASIPEPAVTRVDQAAPSVEEDALDLGTINKVIGLTLMSIAVILVALTLITRVQIERERRATASSMLFESARSHEARAQHQLSEYGRSGDGEAFRIPLDRAIDLMVDESGPGPD